MFEALATTIDDLDIPVDGDALEEALHLRDRLDAKISQTVGRFEATNEHDTADGCPTMATWLRVKGRMTAHDAQRMAKTARRLGHLPILQTAWLDGSVSGGHVAAVVANLNDRTAPLFQSDEDHLVRVLGELDVAGAVVAMKSWAAHAKEIVDDGHEGEPDPDRSAHLSPTLNGGRLDANLEPEAFHAAQAALRLVMGKKGEDDERTPAQRRHDGLAEIFNHFLDHQSDHKGGRHRPHVNITIPLESLIEGKGQGCFDDGTPITAQAARRLACDANVHRVITRANGTVLDYGRSTRTIPAPLFQALCIRDKGCRFPGCDRPAHRTDGHHVAEWIAHRGPTNLRNLVLLCRYHHGVVHRPGWTIELQPDATVIITTPDGRKRRSQPVDRRALAA
ncbi:DUF222 domain-containing protein [Iamia sp. SCSIO 61187]|uniref:HNH endonuclease signature motif containing protein n=1 Tax=Iamia sp. SCSIO 61187 TaxID=2722752 RepID=UPI001C62FD01|nr:HNH endonuclease signature motif containing protein [Iamia sp. SCSIO 61187]QYG91442.1 DUF222 domain-containing protein [Iamia sp. SCSIO 61187]